MLRGELPGKTTDKILKLVPNENYYVLGQKIGEGTFGKVFEAIDRRNNERIAIKEVFQDKRYKNRELDVISRLDNDNIIFMKDYYFVNKKSEIYLYIVMDYYDSSLQAMFKNYRKVKSQIPPSTIKVLAFQIFKGLYYLECNNVCHRDLKPPNILIDQKSLELRICDFGSAKIFEKNQKNVAYICSRYYRAPQLLFSYTKYKTDIDIWSAGCILAEFLTRQPIFPGDSALEQLIQIIKVIGTPSEAYLAKYATEMSEEVVLPKVPAIGWARLLKKYNPEPEFIDLISKILVYDVEERFKPIQILKHKYFHDLTSSAYEQHVKKLPHLLDFSKLRSAKNAHHILELQEIYSSSSNNYQKKMLNRNEDLKEKMETAECTPQNAVQLVKEE